MNVHTGDAAATAEIRALVERCTRAFTDKDVDAVIACHTEDVVCFDCHSQFEARGAAAMRAFLEACMPHMHGPIVHEIDEIAIVADRDAAFSHHHLRTNCRDAAGVEHGGWLRITLGLRRVGGQWLAAHAHVSAPFDPMTNRTMFGLARDAMPDWEGQGCSAS
jgi:uncharacterized protein (TIGR02246 family)